MVENRPARSRPDRSDPQGPGSPPLRGCGPTRRHDRWVITARPPTARTASAMAGASVATTTGPIPASTAASRCARSSARPRSRPTACRAGAWRRRAGMRMSGSGILGSGLEAGVLSKVPGLCHCPTRRGKTTGKVVGARARRDRALSADVSERGSLRRRGRGNAHCQNPSRAAKQRAPRGRPARVKPRSCALVLPSKARRARHDGY